MSTSPHHTPYEYRKPLDRNSIKTTTMLSFILFAVFIVTIIWGLGTFFIDRYYSSMRTQESMRLAASLESQYQRDPLAFEEYAAESALGGDVYIRLDSPEGSMVFDGTSTLRDDGSFARDINNISIELENSPDGTVRRIQKGSTGDDNSRLIFATFISSGQGISTLYIIAPLYPDRVTINIVKNMLVYISIIVLILAVMLAYYLSHRLSAPIESITRSATELSKGNYNVKFDGANFTETKDLAKALNTASYEMEKTEFYQREIIANVSHDLKTPLTMIRSYAEKIIDITGDKPERRNADLHVIISETERLNRLVSEMMTVSNLQSNNVQLNKENFDLCEAAEEVYESFEVLNSEGYEIHFHPCKSTYVYGDKSRISQVMSNYISNAVKYSGDSKYVDVQLKRISNKKIVFHCVDHGVGIAKEDQQHVWDRYYRTSANHERDIEGNGLGLSIVKGILNLHSARFGVDSEEGKGSDFWFEMDIVKKTPDKESRSKSKKDPEYDDDVVVFDK
ncbi:MAG: HAMP domain-containing histidine kinase [Mogibacterium sp.]|nr:HAMP domain-containing histidine kinase [Mogibacterium sp.]